MHRRGLALVLALLTAAPVLAAPLTDPLQTDAGQPGDAPADLPSARTLPGPGTYTGVLLTLDDAADTYRLVVPRDTILTASLATTGSASLELLDPDGTVLGIGAVTGAYTDKSGPWYFRVNSGLAARYTLTVAVTPFPQDDAGSGRDAGWRAASSLALPRDKVAFGNLTGAAGDCIDQWTLPVVAGERLTVRFEWLSLPGPTLVPQTPHASAFVTQAQAGWRNVTATADRDAVWTFTFGYGAAFACGNTGTLYRASVVSALPPPPPPPPACANGLDDDGDGLVDWPLDTGCTSETDDDETDAPPPPPPPPPPMPEIVNVLPSVARPGHVVQVLGANLSGATFTLGGAPPLKVVYDPAGTRAFLTVPRLLPGHHALVASLDGRTATRANATEVLAPADLAVVGVSSRPAPAQAVTVDVPDATREVDVTVANLALNETEPFTVTLWVMPRGQPVVGNAFQAGFRTEPPIAGHGERTLRFVWDGRVAFGTFDVVAVVEAKRAVGIPYSDVEVTSSNDRGTGRDWIVADPGAGLWLRPPG